MVRPLGVTSGSFLKDSPEVVTQSFQRDLLESFEEVYHSGQEVDGFKAMLTYYRSFENSLDYQRRLVNLRKELQKRKKEKTLLLTVKKYNILDECTSEAISKSKKDDRKAFKLASYMSTMVSRDLPYYNEGRQMRDYNRKVLLILGPQSSGKSTLTSAIHKDFSSFRTINRKKIIREANENVNNFYLRDLLLKIKEITHEKIESLTQLYLIDEDKMTPDKRNLFNKYKGEILNIISTEEFNDYVLQQVFRGYALRAQPIFNSNMNIIIDDADINSEQTYSKFYMFFEKQASIKRVLVFNTLEQLLHKYNERNNRFISLLETQNNLQNFLKLIERKEKESGSSVLTYRPVNKIIKNYKEFFLFSRQRPQSANQVLQSLSRSEMTKILSQIIKMDQKFQERLKKWDYFKKISSDLSLELEPLMESIFGDSEKIYITSKIEYDYLIKSKFYPLSDQINLKDLVPDDLYRWLE